MPLVVTDSSGRGRNAASRATTGDERRVHHRLATGQADAATPSADNTCAMRTISLSSSRSAVRQPRKSLGRHAIGAAHEHLSVSEIRRSVATRPKASTSGVTSGDRYGCHPMNATRDRSGQRARGAEQSHRTPSTAGSLGFRAAFRCLDHISATDVDRNVVNPPDEPSVPQNTRSPGIRLSRLGWKLTGLGGTARPRNGPSGSAPMHTSTSPEQSKPTTLQSLNAPSPAQTPRVGPHGVAAGPCVRPAFPALGAVRRDLALGCGPAAAATCRRSAAVPGWPPPPPWFCCAPTSCLFRARPRLRCLLRLKRDELRALVVQRRQAQLRRLKLVLLMCQRRLHLRLLRLRRVDSCYRRVLGRGSRIRRVLLVLHREPRRRIRVGLRDRRPTELIDDGDLRARLVRLEGAALQQDVRVRRGEQRAGHALQITAGVDRLHVAVEGVLRGCTSCAALATLALR